MPNSFRNNKEIATNNIDFDFYNDEQDITGTENGYREQTDYSRIVTKAIIEATPQLTSSKQFIGDVTSNFPSGQDIGNHESKMSGFNNNFDCLSSPTSSVERKMLNLVDETSNNSLFNCLAFNEAYTILNSSPVLSNDKEYSSSSSSSTITTLSSDLTSVSPMSSLLISSFDTDDNSPPTQDNLLENLNNGEYFNSENNNPSERPDSEPSEEEGKQTFDGVSNNEGDDEDDKDNLITKSLESENEIHTTSTSFYDEESYEKPSHNNSVVTNYSDDEYESDILSLDGCHANENEECHESGEETNNTESKISSNSRKNSCSVLSGLEEDFGDISLIAETCCSSKTNSVRVPKRSNKPPMGKKKFNLTFSREEVIKIERDNLTLLKKIMKYSKPRTVSLNQSINKKSSTAINRAKQQKKIEQDNYILYSKISGMSRAKKIF